MCTAFSLSPTQNATCLTPNICGSFNKLKNATASKPYYAWDLTTQYPLLVEIKCEYGYERSDGMGFSGTTECLDNGTFKVTSFSCVPVQCGKYCRYCNGKNIDGYCPQNQPCCCTEADTSEFGRYTSVGLVLDRPLSRFFFPGKTRISCTAGYDFVPGSGSFSPQCIPRDDCVWEPAQEGDGYWTKPECLLQRGWFERGALCATPVDNVVWTNPPPECSNTSEPVCTPEPEFIDIRLTTTAPGASIYYRVDSPKDPPSPVVTAPSNLAESTRIGRSQLLGPSGLIHLEVGRSGCNVFSISSRIRAVAVLKGRPNSEERDLGPEFLITPLGYWPPPVANKTTIPYCPVQTWLPDPVASNMPPPWLPEAPPAAFGGCMAYRYLTFHPTALFSSETDAWALSSLEFYFRGKKVEGIYPIRKNSSTWVFSLGSYPTSQGPSSIFSSALYAKFLGLDGCPLHFDFGKRVFVDSYRFKTASDCNSRDPSRWRLLGSPNFKQWTLVHDATKNSPQFLHTPKTWTQIFPISNVGQPFLQGRFDKLTVRESTDVSGASNRITVELYFNLNVLNVGGTKILISGLRGQSVSTNIISKVSCFESSCYAALEQPAVFNQASGTLETTLMECLSPTNSDDPCTRNASCIWFSFDVYNPSASTGNGIYLTASSSSGINVPAMQFPDPILRSGKSGNITYFSVQESVNEAGKLNTLTFNITLNVMPLSGTTFFITGLTGSLTPSGSPPVVLVFEDKTEQSVNSIWNQALGSITFTLVKDPPLSCPAAEKCTYGQVLTVRAQLLNPKAAQQPVSPRISASLCIRTDCNDVSQSQLKVVAAKEAIFSSIYPCSQTLDMCGICGGDNSLCLGCDRLPNSGRQWDLCGVCGGNNLCVGCDNVVNSTKKFDACGVCGGTGSQCNQNVTVTVNWPSVTANFSVKGLNQTINWQSQSDKKHLIRQAFASTLNIKVDSVDLIQITSIQLQRRDEDPHHFYIHWHSLALQHNYLPSKIDDRGLRQSSIVGSLVEMRFNFATNSEALQAVEFLNLPVAMGNLSDMLFSLGLCGSSKNEVCQSSLVGKPKYVLYGNDDAGSSIVPGAAASSELIAIVASACAVGVSLILCAVYAVYRWKKAVQAREDRANYSLSDLIDAADRGKPENLQAAIASGFKFPASFRGGSSAMNQSFRSEGNLSNSSKSVLSSEPFQNFPGVRSKELNGNSLPADTLHAHTWVVESSRKDYDNAPRSESVSGFLTTGSHSRHKKQRTRTQIRSASQAGSTGGDPVYSDRAYNPDLQSPLDGQQYPISARSKGAEASPFLTSHIGLSRSEVQKLLDRVNTTAQQSGAEKNQDQHHAASALQHSQTQALERHSFNDNEAADVVAV